MKLLIKPATKCKAARRSTVKSAPAIKSATSSSGIDPASLLLTGMLVQSSLDSTFDGADISTDSGFDSSTDSSFDSGFDGGGSFDGGGASGDF